MGFLSPDIVNNVSKDVTKKQIAGIKCDCAKDKSIKLEIVLSDITLQKHPIKPMSFVNTGQENGKYKNSQDGKEEAFDDSKVLELVIGMKTSGCQSQRPFQVFR